jgi:hypothetical protein
MRGPAIVLAVLLPLAAASAQDRGPMPSISAAAPPSAMEQAPRMPEGPLQRIGQTPGQVHFLALSDVSRRDDLVEATVLSIAEPAETRAGQPAPLIVSRHAVWCARKGFADYYAWYAETGRLLDATRNFGERPIVAGSLDALIAARLCDNAPAGETLEGHAAALAAGRKALKGG